MIRTLQKLKEQESKALRKAGKKEIKNSDEDDEDEDDEDDEYEDKESSNEYESNDEMEEDEAHHGGSKNLHRRESEDEEGSG